VSPEGKSLAEAGGKFGRAGVKVRRQMSLLQKGAEGGEMKGVELWRAGATGDLRWVYVARR